MYSSDNAGGFPLGNANAAASLSGTETEAANTGNMLPGTGRLRSTGAENIPVPLPEYGGGPVSPDPGHVPVPLPEYSDNGFPDSGHVPVPLPEYGDNGFVTPDAGHVPVPLPEIGTPISPGRPGPFIPVRPQPNPPCYYCTTSRNSSVRFLNAAVGYRPFRVYINNRFIINGLGYASLTPYGKIAGGFQTITITGMNGYVYLRKSMPIRSDESSTMAIINTPGGIDLLQISDTSCVRPASMSCFRVCNLASNTNPLDVILTDGRVVFSDVRFKEVTPFRRARPGEYAFYLAETNLRPMPRFMDIETMNAETAVFELPKALVSFYVDIGRNAVYTVYILSVANMPDSVQTIVIEDR